MFLCNYLKIIRILQVFLKKEEERKRRGTKLSLKTTIGAIELKKAIEKKKIIPLTSSNLLIPDSVM